MKIQIIETYDDLTLNKRIKKEIILEVTKERGKYLIQRRLAIPLEIYKGE